MHRQFTENEEHFRCIFEEAPIGMALVGRDGRFLQVNQAFCDMVGYGERELIGHTILDLTHPDDVQKDESFIARMFQGANPSYKVEKRYLRKDRQTIWVDLTVTLLYNRARQVIHSLMMFENIIERKRAKLLEEALKVGVASSLLKDVSPHELLTTLQRVLGGETVLGQELLTRLLLRLTADAEREERPLEPLSPREYEVLQLLIQGQTNREIAQNLMVSISTVKIHVEHILAKLDVSDRTQAAVRAVQMGLLRASGGDGEVVALKYARK
jgi:PAS domain S-box-containing protein